MSHSSTLPRELRTIMDDWMDETCGGVQGTTTYGSIPQYDIDVINEQLSSEQKKTYKTVFIGDEGVGKSSLLRELINVDFDESYTASQKGASIKRINDGLTSVWDISGGEKYNSKRNAYYIDADYAVVMFDVGSKKSLLGTKHWIVKLRESSPNVKIVLCGNKTDLEREVRTTKGKALAETMDVFYNEISVKNCIGISKMMNRFK